MAAILTLPMESDFRIRLDKARPELAQENYLNAGTCTYSLETQSGTVVSSGTLNYVTDSDGRYEVIVDKVVTTGLVENKIYVLFVTFSEDGRDKTYRRRIRAVWPE